MAKVEREPGWFEVKYQSFLLAELVGWFNGIHAGQNRSLASIHGIMNDNIVTIISGAIVHKNGNFEKENMTERPESITEFDDSVATGTFLKMLWRKAHVA